MRLTTLQLACAATVLASLCACAKPAATTTETTSVAAATATPDAAIAASVNAARAAGGGCSFVTQAEMRAILHAPVVAHVSGSDKCTYAVPSHASPYVQVEVDRGDGRVAMRAAGAMSHVEAGMTNPLAGLGDQATTVGPAVMIRTGDDLVQIVLSGVDGRLAKAKLIFKTVKARL